MQKLQTSYLAMTVLDFSEVTADTRRTPPHVAWLRDTPLDLDDGSAVLLSDTRYLLGQEDNKT